MLSFVSIYSKMAYSYDYSYYYPTCDDSFSNVSDGYYCPVHHTPQVSMCNYQQPYYYYSPMTVTPQHVSHQTNLSSPSSLIKVRHPEKTRRFSPEQIRILEEHYYKVDKYVNKITIDDLSTRTQLTPAQIRVWFTNKRTRERN